MKKKIFITRRLHPIAREILEKNGFLVAEPDHSRTLSQNELKVAVANYDGILSTICDKLSEEVLRSAEHLSVISNYAIGLDNIDLDFAKSKNIAVFNTPDIVTHSTADLALAILLTFVRQICKAANYVRKERWRDWDPHLFVGEELFGKTLGIIGYGRIGKEIAKRAKGFGLRVIFYHYRETGDSLQVSMDTLLQESDYLSLSVPLTEKTKHMINYDLMKRMKKHPVIVNVARGAIIQTDDLVKALQEGLIRGAALDVTDPEPMFDHPLCQIENCLIVPHIGTSTEECRREMARLSAENIISHFNQK